MSLVYKGEDAILISYRKRVEEEMQKAVSSMGEKTTLKNAIEYALMTGGKRFRPMIVMMIAEALQNNFDVTPVSLAVEYFHTASLIADDLPCMDNDDERRSHPSLHKKFDESVAILASYTLISHGYEGIYQNTEILRERGLTCCDKIGTLALQTVTRCAGIFGATTGQFLDLYPPDSSMKTIQKIIELKTVTLFEISFVLGWLYSGGSISQLDEIKACAYHFGMSFQIADDFADISQDDPKEKVVNIVYCLGVDRAFSIFQKELHLFEQKMSSLSIFTAPFRIFTEILTKMAMKYAKEPSLNQI